MKGDRFSLKVSSGLFSCLYITLLFVSTATAQQSKSVTVVAVDSGWASNSINAVIFRKNALISYKGTQFISYYDGAGYVVLGKRKSGSKNWTLHKTVYKGNVADAHNTISMMVDGDGYLHLSWDHHNNPLNYCKSVKPLSLELTAKLQMTGKSESRVSYPEFHRMKNGNIIFLYRNGASGQGDLVLNAYDCKTRQWKQLQANLVDGQGERNAYWQAFVDANSTIHLSWVWRESPDVASNHDLCYARSKDGGSTWEKSTGEKYQLPINAATAEYAFRIPQKSELINQTSMYADGAGNPYIATYWRDQGSRIPQYQLVYMRDNAWVRQNLGFRKTAFSLSGGGTKKIPVSRPQVVAWHSGKDIAVAFIFRDEERGNKVSVAINPNLSQESWVITNLSDLNVGSWEPSYDTECWKEKEILNLFVQKVEQVDAEGKGALPPQMVQVLECDLKQFTKETLRKPLGELQSIRY